jgi:2-C-methyl-D-erythritol 4-phosphate cytidylyltransferase
MAKYVALIPAAGSGSRMKAELPKQYLDILGKPMIYHGIKCLCDAPEIHKVYVVLAPEDTHWLHYDWAAFALKLRPLFCGGDTRAQSVLNGLLALQNELDAKDWVLVHDAARPCLTEQHLHSLITEVAEDKVGGILAVPVADTLKREDNVHRVAQTERREGLWQAQTPQMFRFGLLLEALQTMGGEMPTDESKAVEMLGLHPRLVLSDSRNLKVTYPQDLQLAQLILTHLAER